MQNVVEKSGWEWERTVDGAKRGERVVGSLHRRVLRVSWQSAVSLSARRGELPAVALPGKEQRSCFIRAVL